MKTLQTAPSGSLPCRVRLRMMEGYQKRRWLLRYLHSNKIALLPPYPPQWRGWTLLHPTGGLTPTCPEMLINDAWKARSKANKEAHQPSQSEV